MLKIILKKKKKIQEKKQIQGAGSTLRTNAEYSRKEKNLQAVPPPSRMRSRSHHRSGCGCGLDGDVSGGCHKLRLVNKKMACPQNIPGNCLLGCC